MISSALRSACHRLERRNHARFSSIRTTPPARKAGWCGTSHLPRWHRHAPETLCHGEYVIGHDARTKQWARLGAMDDGSYWVMAAPRHEDTLTYSYMSSAASAKTLYIRRGPDAYVVERPSYPEHGKIITEHHSWRRK